MEYILLYVQLVLLLALIVVFIWLFGRMPGNIAKKRNHPNADAIRICGWIGIFTFGIIWIVAMVWAFTSPETTNPKTYIKTAEPTKKCPFCAEQVKLEAVMCRFCNRMFSEDKRKTETDKDDSWASILDDLPSKWKIVGKKNGKTVTATASAMTAVIARKKAESKGILVDSVTPVTDFFDD